MKDLILITLLIICIGLVVLLRRCEKEINQKVLNQPACVQPAKDYGVKTLYAKNVDGKYYLNIFLMEK